MANGYFYNMLDISASNSFVIFRSSEQSKEMSRFDFIQTIADALIKPQIQVRLLVPNMHAELVSTMKRITGEKEEAAPVVHQVQENPVPSKRKRCHLCPRNRDRKTSLECNMCKQPICNGCSKTICNRCNQN